MKFTDEWFKKCGFDISKEPFVRPNCMAIKIHKNYICDSSGKYDGYIIEYTKREKRTIVRALTYLL